MIDLKKPTVYRNPKKIITGVVTYCINFEAMKVLNYKTKKLKKVDVIEKFISNPKIVIKIIKVSKSLMNKKIRLTLDYLDDLIFFKKVYKHLNITSSTSKIVKYLLKNKNLSNKNFYLNKIWKLNQIRETK